jgi:glycosyltransferase involved in cell wall biosynthesis
MATVGIVIPSYNRAAYLPGCLECIFAQTYQDYEIIIVDDGSTDDTHAVLEPWIRAGKVRYIRQENAGPGTARNRGARETTASLIAFLDSDDLWPRDKLAWQVAYLNDHPEVDVVGGGFQWMDESGASTGQPVLRDGPTRFEDVFAGPPFVSPGETLIRRSALEAAGWYDEAIETWPAEDFDLWMKLARNKPLISLPRVALHYRRHPANSSRSALRMYLPCRRVLKRHLPSVPPERRAAARAASIKWLYEYRGAAAIREWKALLLKGDLRDTPRYARALLWFLGGALRDARLLKTILQEMAPARLNAAAPAKSA